MRRADHPVQAGNAGYVPCEASGDCRSEVGVVQTPDDQHRLRELSHRRNGIERETIVGRIELPDEEPARALPAQAVRSEWPHETVEHLIGERGWVGDGDAEEFLLNGS